MIEIRQIVEAAIERDIDDLRAVVVKTQRRRSQTCPQHILMRRHAGHALERAQEIELAQPRRGGEAREGCALRERLLQSVGNFPQDAPRLNPYCGHCARGA
ncbi:hypothetical protein P3T22_004325 [Paraburkholderia sp. GAS348]